MHTYVAYKRSTSDQKTQTGWEKIFHAIENKEETGIAIIISGKIEFKIRSIIEVIKASCNDKGTNPTTGHVFSFTCPLSSGNHHTVNRPFSKEDI